MSYDNSERLLHKYIYSCFSNSINSKLKQILLISEKMRTADIVLNWELENLVFVAGFCT